MVLAGSGEGDGSLTNWVCDVPCAEDHIRFVAVKGVRFLMWSRIHGTKELVDEASFNPNFGIGSRSLHMGHLEIVEDLSGY